MMKYTERERERWFLSIYFFLFAKSRPLRSCSESRMTLRFLRHCWLWFLGQGSFWIRGSSEARKYSVTVQVQHISKIPIFHVQYISWFCLNASRQIYTIETFWDCRRSHVSHEPGWQRPTEFRDWWFQKPTSRFSDFAVWVEHNGMDIPRFLSYSSSSLHPKPCYLHPKVAYTLLFPSGVSQVMGP